MMNFRRMVNFTGSNSSTTNTEVIAAHSFLIDELSANALFCFQEIASPDSEQPLFGPRDK